MFRSQREEGETIMQAPDIQSSVDQSENQHVKRLLETSLVGDNYTPVLANTSARKRKLERQKAADKTAGSKW